MNSRKLIFAVFVLVALAQLFVPAKMILDREKVLDNGKEYRFKTAPIDPYDIFRGKYIVLSYEDNVFKIQDEKGWINGEKVFLILKTDKDGFAEIQAVLKDKPAGSKDFLKASVNYVSNDGSGNLVIEYPFDRFYMEESKALPAEKAYLESLRDSSRVTYAQVKILNGESVLKDVLIDGIPLRDLVKAR